MRSGVLARGPSWALLKGSMEREREMVEALRSLGIDHGVDLEDVAAAAAAGATGPLDAVSSAVGTAAEVRAARAGTDTSNVAHAAWRAARLALGGDVD